MKVIKNTVRLTDINALNKGEELTKKLLDSGEWNKIPAEAKNKDIQFTQNLDYGKV